MADYTKFLNDLYNNPESPAAFAGVDQLWHEATKILKHMPREAVEDYLQGHRTYTIHRPRRTRFPKSRTVPAGYLTDVQCDLADFQKLSQHNKGFKYILVGIDVLSKRIFTAPIKTKNSKDMIPAFEHLLTQMEMYPHRIFSDKGTEFTNKDLMSFFEEKDIEKYTPNASTVKASLAENCIKRLKQRLYRYMSEKQTLKWVDVLEKIVIGMNRAKSRVLGGLRPIDVSFNNAREIRDQVFGPMLGTKSHYPKKRQPRFNVGDHVRMSRNKNVFAKGYLPNYHDEILEIAVVKPGGPDSAYGVTRYRVKDHQGEMFKGYFYEQELTKVKKDENTSYRVEEVIRSKKGKDGKKKYLVKFLEYPTPEWIDESDFV
jgi:hypothetical protein